MAELVDSESLFGRGERIVVGVSGGPDSMALLHALTGLNRQAGYQLELHIAHLNHQLRAREADEDEAFVRGAAERLGLPCTVERIDIGAIAAAETRSTEETARRHRYAFFERVCHASGNAGCVAVGHHADDNAETVLNRVIRGTGWRGLTGIPVRRRLSPGSATMLVRPLLPFTRQELFDYLAAIGAGYRLDHTNDETDATRNRLRHVVLPLLETEFNPQVRDALVRLAQQARWMEEYLHDTVERAFDALLIAQTDQDLVLNAASLARKPRIVQAEILRRAVRALGVRERNLGFVHLQSVTRLLIERFGTRRLDLPDGLVVTRSYDRLSLARPTAEPHEELAEQVTVHVPGVTVLPRRHLEIRCRVFRAGPEETTRWRHRHPRGEEWLDYDSLHLPLTVRTRRPGDRFWPLGAPGTRKVSDFLIDAKVETTARDRVALLCDQLGPVYAIGYRIDDRVKLTSNTSKVLHVQTKPLSASGADR